MTMFVTKRVSRNSAEERFKQLILYMVLFCLWSMATTDIVIARGAEKLQIGQIQLVSKNSKTRIRGNCTNSGQISGECPTQKFNGSLN